MKQGSLQIKSGKYYAVFRFHGKQKWVNLQIPTTRGNKRKAETALQKVLSKYEDREEGFKEYYLTEYLLEWLNDIKSVIKPSTYETYEVTVNAKIIPYFKGKGLKLSTAEPKDFTEYFKFLKLNGKKNGGGLSEKSVKNIRGVLSVAFDDAYKNHLVQSNPINNSRMPVFENNIQREKVVYSPDEVRRLLGVARSNESHVYLFLLLALFTGLRNGELQALTWNNIDFKNRLLTVNKSRTGSTKAVTSLVTKPKTNSSNRVIPLTDELIDELKAERVRQEEYKQLFGNCYDDECDFVIRNKFGKPYTNLRAINRVVNRLEEKAGLQHCTIHGLRHTVINLLDDNGIPIQDISTMVGHSSTYTTERIYIHRKRAAKRENINVLESVINHSSEVC